MRTNLFRSLLFSGLALLCFSSGADAAGTSATIKWTNPSQYSDGTSLPVTDIGSYDITWTRLGSTVAVGTFHVSGGPATQTTISGLVCGGYNFTMTVTTSATALQPNSTSDPTSPASYPTGISCKPNPPTGVTVS